MTMPSTTVTPEQVLDALNVVNAATVSLCEALIEKHGTSRKAAARIGVTDVHFCNMRGGYAKASLKLMEVMAVELDD